MFVIVAIFHSQGQPTPEPHKAFIRYRNLRGWRVWWQLHMVTKEASMNYNSHDRGSTEGSVCQRNLWCVTAALPHLTHCKNVQIVCLQIRSLELAQTTRLFPELKTLTPLYYFVIFPWMWGNTSASESVPWKWRSLPPLLARHWCATSGLVAVIGDHLGCFFCFFFKKEEASSSVRHRHHDSENRGEKYGGGSRLVSTQKNQVLQITSPSTGRPCISSWHSVYETITIHSPIDQPPSCAFLVHMTK